MISWIIRLCALCSMSAMMQLMVTGDHAKAALKTICGLLMLHMTFESAQQLMKVIASEKDITQAFSWLIR